MLQEMPAEINMNNQKTETHTSRSARVTATVKVEPVNVGEGLKLNPYYFKTVPGIIKLVQVLFGMICLGCGSPALIGYARFFLFVAALCYIITILLCVVYILGVNTALPSIPWLSGELIFTVLAALLFLIAAITELVMTSSYDWHSMFLGLRDQYIAAGVFGIFQMIAYGAGAFFLFMERKATQPPPAQPSAN